MEHRMRGLVVLWSRGNPPREPLKYGVNQESALLCLEARMINCLSLHIVLRVNHNNSSKCRVANSIQVQPTGSLFIEQYSTSDFDEYPP